MEFPTFFRLRVVGHNDDDFAAFIFDRLIPFIPELQAENLEPHPSNGGKYLAVHVSFVAISREQLDGIYGDLSGDERVLWVM
jgi:putative lipoic acid-binding regulatory protein